VQDLTAVLEAVRILAVALSPVIPALCGRIYSQLGYSKADFESLSWVRLLTHNMKVIFLCISLHQCTCYLLENVANTPVI
jgi:methionyl-tRNA synthetase